MKSFRIKYLTYDGDVKVKTVKAWDKHNAIHSLTNCREVYFVKPFTDLKTLKVKN